MVKLANATYGKDKVRVFRIVRNGNVQHLSFPLGILRVYGASWVVSAMHIPRSHSDRDSLCDIKVLCTM